MGRASQRYAWIGAGVALAVLLLALAHKLLSGAMVARWDSANYFHPYYTLVADLARSGSLLLWDPWTNGGVPVLAEPQVGVFSPLVLLTALATGGSSKGFVIYWLLVWFLGGAGTLVLARHFGAPPWGGFSVALGVLFSGLYTGNAEHTSWVTGFSFVPWIIWRLDVALLERRPLAACQAGALWGFSALAAYPGFTVMTGLLCALWALGRVSTQKGRATAGADGETVPARSRSREVGFAAFVLATVFGVGVVVLSPTYVAYFAEGAGYHLRATSLGRVRAIRENALMPSAAVTLASPYFSRAKLAMPTAVFPRTDVSSCSVYTGALVLGLALFALASKPREAWRWWVIGVGLFFLAASFGDALPVRGLLYDAFYPARYFRHSSLLRAYFIVSLAVLAAAGTRDLATALGDRDRSAWTRFAILAVALAAVALAAFAATARSLPAESLVDLALGRAHLILVWSGLVGLAIVGRFAPARVGAVCVPALTCFLATADAAATSYLTAPTFMNAESEAVERWRELDRLHVPSVDLTANGLQRVTTPSFIAGQELNNDQLILKVPVFSAYNPAVNEIHTAMAADPLLGSFATGADRVWFAEAVVVCPTDPASFRAFADRAAQLGAPPLVVSPRDMDPRATDPTATSAIAESPPARRVSVKVDAYTADRLLLRVEAPADGWLLVTDRWAQGWKARVNGSDVAVSVGNFLFRAVPVSTGQNVVEFVYEPAGIPLLVALSWVTLAVVASLSIVRRGRAVGAPPSSDRS